ncbi:FKBP-type peptidyl-prolyl cis-trans isomerase [Sanguibacter suarezii]|uniref:FKBP-type peptidyl-prolyl cis-trans isomerase n=1 Tax=Sanguibacter suarezii TaxID=60921 RepID=UPI000836B8D8|nr:FKBP-type peptidyl-prolyl cis-trans isomerase [Sanguibacter suarezii]
MKNRTVRGITALALGAALLLSACGSSDDAESPSPSASESTVAEPTAADIAALEGVTVEGEPGTEPTLTIPTPLTTSTDVTRVTSEGTGDEITEGSLVGLQLVMYTGSDGAKLQSTWESEPFEAQLSGADLPPALEEAVVGQKVGTRILYAQPQTTADGASDTIVFAVDLLSTREAPTRAQGEAVTPAEGLPTVTLDDSGVPSLDIPEGYTAPSELVVQTLIKGDGPVVEAGQAIQVQYAGWKLSDGSQFESSWESAPFTTVIGSGAVIAGWDQGLVGQTVGSQVLLVIPKALAYGGTASELADEDLVFVVDILRVT